MTQVYDRRQKAWVPKKPKPGSPKAMLAAIESLRTALEVERHRISTLEAHDHLKRGEMRPRDVIDALCKRVDAIEKGAVASGKPAPHTRSIGSCPCCRREVRPVEPPARSGVQLYACMDPVCDVHFEVYP